jgi:rSAM/selenodomain-associated transferase 1
MNRNALIIIAKRPDKKKVKTRLRNGMTDEQRVKLYTKFLEDTISRMRGIRGTDTFIAFAPDSAVNYFSRFSLSLLPLPERDLGNAMLYAFQEVFHKGYTNAVLVGVDIPRLSADIILKAFTILLHKDVVFGPARDGGYYLVGMRGFKKEIFQDVPWSSEQTLEKSIERADRFGYSIGMTELLRDIDTIEDARTAGLLFDE